MEPLFESASGPLLKSGLQPFARYGTRQETVSQFGTQVKNVYNLSDFWIRDHGRQDILYGPARPWQNF